jgi:hypothetical protein
MLSLRDLGSYPFPRVELPIATARWLKTKRDDEARELCRRVDSDVHEAAVATARSLIYDDHYAVNSKRVEDLLKCHSWTPTPVSAFGLVKCRRAHLCRTRSLLRSASTGSTGSRWPSWT